ncbi:UDP-glycosyltransferase UGT5-like isoform X1 [Diorhabda carinulata]|uniref:UDP-glycosyltransferase UGT5-like isoform X1 n=1 Tax=Diorhabda carinulata TaxID=1163345 RepID=UPI0025A19ECF|nr:UDP-glycosyltransferase UGT5-like isoform X1 [Diorhabda carinulata]
MKLVLLLFLWGVFPFLNAHNILVVLPFCAHSHFMLGFKLVLALIERSHNVTLISCYPQKTPITNLHEISLKQDTELLFREFHEEFSDTGSYSYFGQMIWATNFSYNLGKVTLKNKGVQELMNSNSTFDVMIMENVANYVIGILRHRFNCPLIVQSPFITDTYHNNFIDNPFSPAYIPNLIATYDSYMNFWERLQNLYREIVLQFIRDFKMIPNQMSLMRELFPDAPDLYNVIFNPSLHFVQSNPSLFDSIPLQQNVKEVGGIHVTEGKPLPKDIEEFMNDAKDGVILFSMGSLFNGSTLGMHMKSALLRTFSKIKQKVIWSIDDQSIITLDNVMIRKWVPQNDIMAHPNTILFISHGGLLGTYEAIYHGVPILGLPVAWDQKRNIEEAARKGFAIRLNLIEFTEEAFSKALHELVTNSDYRLNAKKRSRIMRDRIATPLEEAVFWTEYVIRHKGAPHLKPTVMDLKWYQRYLVDVLIFITVIPILVIFAIILFARTIITLKSKLKRD